MTTTQQDKPGGKPRPRSRKAEQRTPKNEQRQAPTPDPRDEDQISPMVASDDAPAVEAAAPADVPVVGEADVPLVGEVLPPAAVGAAGPPDIFGIQNIMNAYADYTWKSLQESRFFVERLMGVRSLDQAIEVQSDFARSAYANLVAESQKICGLYVEWARQIFRPWEVLAARRTRAGRPI